MVTGSGLTRATLEKLASSGRFSEHPISLLGQHQRYICPLASCRDDGHGRLTGRLVVDTHRDWGPPEREEGIFTELM